MKKAAAAEALALLAVTGVGAAWATHAGTLPGRGPSVAGPIGMGLGWAGLFAALGVVYRSRLGEGTSTRGVVRRVGLALLLALLSTHLGRLLAAALVHPMTWDHLFYLKRLAPPALVGFWCAALLPAETASVLRTALRSRTLTPIPQLAVLLFSAAALVSCADLGFEWSGGSAAGATLKSEVIYPEAWTANVLVLFSAYALVFVATRKVGMALVSISPVYAVLGLATLLKIRYMHSAVQPLDLLRIPELLPFLESLVGVGALGLAVGAIALWLGALVAVGRAAPSSIPPLRRCSIGALAVTGLLAFPVAFFGATSIPDDVEYSSVTPADVLLSRFRVRGGEFKELARVRGFLLSFISELPSAFTSAPPGYSAATVTTALSNFCGTGAPVAERRSRVNLILYLVESFMDPEDLGLRYTADPIPNLRALQKTHIGGHGIVPEEFGGSANTEFEALTGMSMSFLPEGGVAYRLYLKRPVPALPSLLGRLGYRTTAVQADPRSFYDRERAYRLLGFDRVVWLGDDPDVERDRRGWWPSDDAVVEAVVQATQGDGPFFVFAFPSSTHFPYTHGSYRSSDLDVFDVPSPDAAAEVKEYINTLHEADRAIGMLIEHFRGRADSTIIAVLGDHLPPLPEGALRTFFQRLGQLSAAEGARMRRRVPLLVWANFPLPHETSELSVNALPSYLLEKMEIVPPGFLAVPDAVRRRFPVVVRHAVGSPGQTGSEPVSDADRRLLGDYRLLQYDLLLGDRFALRDSTSQAQRCRVATP